MKYLQLISAFLYIILNELQSHGSTKIYALDEVCRRQAIELVPMLVLTSIHQRYECVVLSLSKFICKLCSHCKLFLSQNILLETKIKGCRWIY